MKVTFFFKNLSKKEEESFVDYVNQKIDSIAGLITNFASDAAILRASMEKFDKHDAYEAELSLNLPIKNIIAREASHTITKAVDFSKDRLISQLKKQLALLRKDRKHKSIRTAEVEKEEIVSYLHPSK